MNPTPKFDCKNCKHNESDICVDCQITDEGVPTRYEAKDADIDLNWIGALMMFGAVVYQVDTSKLLGDLKMIIENYKEKSEAMEKEIRDGQSCAVSKPNGCCTSYYPMNPIPCFRETPSYQRDCYYFSEEQDMGAHIPCCDRISGIEGYEPKNCNKDCPFYVTHTKVQELIRKDVDSLVGSELRIIVKNGDELCPHCYQKLDSNYAGLRHCFCKYCGGKISR